MMTRTKTLAAAIIIAVGSKIFHCSFTKDFSDVPAVETIITDPVPIITPSNVRNVLIFRERNASRLIVKISDIIVLHSPHHHA
jgi:hypothetical protein